jgi:type IV pilus assembly protein PilA
MTLFGSSWPTRSSLSPLGPDTTRYVLQSAPLTGITEVFAGSPAVAYELQVGLCMPTCQSRGLRMPKAMGFSLIELLIVVAIILLIAAIAIPNFLRAKISANESSAAGAIRAIASSQIVYFNTYPTVGYAATLTDLGGAAPCTPGPSSACLLDNAVSSAVPGSSGKSGYQFQSTGLSNGGLINSNYVTGATPLSVGLSGNRNLCATDIQVLRAQPGGGLPVTTLAACAGYPSTP